MSKDLIDRRSAIDALESGKDKTAKCDIGGFYNAIIQNDIDKLRNLPSAQPEIIRCKDCKYWREDHTCKEHSLVSHMLANDFCSRAERRTDD